MKRKRSLFWHQVWHGIRFLALVLALPLHAISIWMLNHYVDKDVAGGYILFTLVVPTVAWMLNRYYLKEHGDTFAIILVQSLRYRVEMLWAVAAPKRLVHEDTGLILQPLSFEEREAIRNAVRLWMARESLSVEEAIRGIEAMEQADDFVSDLEEDTRPPTPEPQPMLKITKG